MIGLYIHIPFCRARCGYCDFVTFTGKEDKIESYVEDLCREIELYGGKSSHTSLFQLRRPGGRRPGSSRSKRLGPGLRPAGPTADDKLVFLSTIFFGGGTPSLLEPHHVGRILETVRSSFALDPEAEITLEANPESISAQKASGWRRAGVNRISIGLQAFDNVLLKAMDRLHTVEQFKAAYAAVRSAGFENVNFDLIYGLPDQDLTSWQNTLRSAAALGPEHLSLYSLTVEEHTPFAAAGVTVNDDLQGDMYAWARSYLKEQGFDQYEVSNFSRPGLACRHNLIYWRQQDYLGLGVGAVGCVGNERWTNHKTLAAYAKDIEAGRLPRLSIETLDAASRKFENLMLGLRLREGFDWGEEENPEWLAQRALLRARGLLEEVTPGRWRIPDAVVALTNQVLLPFVPA